MNFFNNPEYKVFYIKPNSKEPFDKWNSEEKWKNYKGCVCNEQYNHALWLAGSGLVAIDYDPRNEDSETPKILFKLRSFLLSTYSHATQSGGRHYVFSLDKDFAYTFKGKICNGIDIKYNGYIVIPPSSIDGNKYEEVKESENPILPLPKEVEDYCLYRLDEDTQESYAITPDRDKKFDYKKICHAIQNYANENKLGYEIWFGLAMCLHSIFEGSDEGFEYFKIISNNKYYSDSDSELLKKWNSIDGSRQNRFGLKTFIEILASMDIDIDDYLDSLYVFQKFLEEKKEEEEREKIFKNNLKLLDEIDKYNRQLDRENRRAEKEAERIEKENRKAERENRKEAERIEKENRRAERENRKEIERMEKDLRQKIKEKKKEQQENEKKAEMEKVEKSQGILSDLLEKESIEEPELLARLETITNIKCSAKFIISISKALEELAVKYFNTFVVYIESSKSYAILKDMGTATESFTLYTTNQFKERFSYLYIRSSVGKQYPLASYYLDSSLKKSYFEIAYAPTSNRKDMLTVFPRGCVSIEPHDTDYDPEVIKPFCDMIYHNLCGIPLNEEELYVEDLKVKKNLYKYLLWYVAHTLRKPQEAQSVILAFWGDQGTGKNTFTETIEKLFISTRMVSNTMADQLEGVYTDFVGKSFWCVINEFPPKLESKAWARLKAYTGTSGFLTMNPKGEKQYQALIRSRFITTSNLYPAFGETSDNRRVVRIQTEKHIRDFSELARLKYDENFLHNLAKYFNTIDLNEFEPCVIPKSLIMSREELEMEKTLKKERTRDTEVMHEAFLKLLSVDEAPYIFEKNNQKLVSLKLLFKSVYQKFYELTGLRRSMEYQTSVQFINKMARFYPHPNSKIKAPKQITVSRFGEVMKVYDLDEMRAYFLVGNSLNWDD